MDTLVGKFGINLSQAGLDGHFEAPVLPAGLRKLSAVQCKALEAYYSAYASWATAKGAHERRVAAEAELASSAGRSDEVVSQVSEPRSEVSARSSASSGKAAKRARWRANRAARAARQAAGAVGGGVDEANSEVSSVGSTVTYTVCGPMGDGPDRFSSGGFCYVLAVLPEYVEEARRVLGEDPTFFEMLAAPSQWFLSGLARLKVSRVSPGLFHVSASGFVTLLSCLASVVQSSPDGLFACGTLGGRPEMRVQQLSGLLLAKAPALDDKCGAGSFRRGAGFVSEVVTVLGRLLPRASVVATGSLSAVHRVSEPGPGSVVVVLFSDFVRCSSAGSSVDTYPLMADLSVTRTVVVHSGFSALNCSGRAGTVFVAVGVSGECVPRMVELLHAAGNYVGAVEVAVRMRDGTPGGVLWADLFYNSSRIGVPSDLGLHYAMLSGGPSMRDLSYLTVCGQRGGDGDAPVGPTVRQLFLRGFSPNIYRLCPGSAGTARVCLSTCQPGQVREDSVVQGWHVP